MKIGVYFCNCGPNISEKIDAESVRRAVEGMAGFGYFRLVEFLCSSTGTDEMEADLRSEKPDRVVVAACSVRDHEETFREVMSRAGLNPFLMQMVNIREHIAWVTADREQATAKAASQIRAAIRRVALHEPLERVALDINTDVLVIGSGPAGLKAALTLAEAGRKVYLVEKEPMIGGMPVRYEEMFPNIECGPCMLEPVMGEILHGPHAGNIELFTLSEVEEVVGYYGNFSAKIRKQPRGISADLCIGCAMCIEACPASSPNPYNCGMNEKKALDFPFRGVLPNLPYIDQSSCLRTAKGEDCTACRDACLVEGAVLFDEPAEVVTRSFGAIILATGGALYDCSRLPNLGHGKVPDVVDALEFERMLAASGPTEGVLKTSSGKTPESVAIVHCVGSLDARHRNYCSGVCCEAAFKYNHLIAHKAEGASVTHFYKTISVAGKEEFKLYDEAKGRANTRFVRYDDLSELSVSCGEPGSGVSISFARGGGIEANRFDLVVLCPAVVPSEGTKKMMSLLELSADRFGFAAELHGRMDSARGNVRGVFLAGVCQAPMDVQKTVNQALAATGLALSGLVPGRKMIVEPVTAEVDPDRCAACRSCIPVCPYKAIAFDAEKGVAVINAVLCMGCGTCVAACPTGAIKGIHFTNDEILAEISEVLA
jgi:heterodisulfide reductase subunit A